MLDALEGAGHEAFLVGGCVRDSLLGRVPHDWDITTSATPEEMMVCVPYPHYDDGLVHGTVAFIVDGNVVEATTYRCEGKYSDGRHPDSISFARDIDEDLSRRDFTVNAMAFSPTRGLEDLFGGASDLENNVLRCVGNAKERFGEDALRIVRALRFCSVYGFEPDGETLSAANLLAPTLSRISRERISSELFRAMGAADGKHLAKMCDAFGDVLCAVIPELSVTRNFDQANPHHDRDLWHHLLDALAAAPKDPVIRLAALLQDIGKPPMQEFDDDGIGHYFGHMEKGAEMAENILSGLRFDGTTIGEVSFLIGNHHRRPELSARSVRRFISKCGNVERIDKLLELMRADASAHAPKTAEEKLSYIDELARLIDEEISRQAPFSISDMDFSGRDLIDLGWESGPALGSELKRLFSLVLDGEIPNEHDVILEMAERPGQNMSYPLYCGTKT